MTPYVTTCYCPQPRWFPVVALPERSRGCGEGNGKWLQSLHCKKWCAEIAHRSNQTCAVTFYSVCSGFDAFRVLFLMTSPNPPPPTHTHAPAHLSISPGGWVKLLIVLEPLACSTWVVYLPMEQGSHTQSVILVKHDG